MQAVRGIAIALLAWGYLVLWRTWVVLAVTVAVVASGAFLWNWKNRLDTDAAEQRAFWSRLCVELRRQPIVDPKALDWAQMALRKECL